MMTTMGVLGLKSISVLTQGGVATQQSYVTHDMVLLHHSAAAILPYGRKLTQDIVFPFIGVLRKPGARAHS